MKKRNTLYNTKRALVPYSEESLKFASILVARLGYGGNPEHKKNPGDFGLTPPSGPRPGKSLCDVVSVFSREIALNYLKKGAARCLISDRNVDGFPKNIWSVTDDGVPLEAQLENPVKGTYHGYPMPESDPFTAQILARWEETA